MSTDYGKCQSCGAPLTPADFQAPACRYCGVAFVHHQQAAAKVAELHAVMGMMRAPSPPGVYVDPSHAVVVLGMVPISHGSVPYAGVPFDPAQSPPGAYPQAGYPLAFPQPVFPMPANPQSAGRSTALVTMFAVLAIGMVLVLVLGAVAMAMMH